MKKGKRLIVFTLIFSFLLTFLISPNESVMASTDTVGRNNKSITHDSRFDGMTIRSGIDVSRWQGDIDWNAVKNDGIEFAFIKIAGRDAKDGSLYLDSKAYQNLQGAISAGLSVGVYFFSQATSENEAVEEANYICNAISGYSISLPVVMDYEYTTYTENNVKNPGRLTNAGLNKSQMTQIAAAFCNRVAYNGYTPCIYANKYFLETSVDGQALGQNYKIWLARYTSNGSTNYNCNSADYSGNYSFWQYAVCTSNTVSGISSSIDVDYWYDDGSFSNSGVSVSYSSHVQNMGWQSWISNGNISGTCGKSLQLEALKIKINGDSNLGVIYKTHVQNYGWTDNCFDGEMSGTTGSGLHVEAICLALTGTDASLYDIYYRVHAQNFGWMGWTKNGQLAGSSGFGYRLEAIQIMLLPKNSSVSSNLAGITGDTSQSYISCSSDYSGINYNPSVVYTTHVQYAGWQNDVSNGATAGTEGQSLRLEGIKIDLRNQPYSGQIVYKTHVQNVGWQAPVCDNGLAGTVGQSLRLEAIEICLGGEMANHYDVYYRVHAQGFGWMGWTCNGNSAGTAGYGYRLEAIQIVLVPKGESAPSNSYNGVISNTATSFKSI